MDGGERERRRVEKKKHLMMLSGGVLLLHTPWKNLCKVCWDNVFSLGAIVTVVGKVTMTTSGGQSMGWAYTDKYATCMHRNAERQIGRPSALMPLQTLKQKPKILAHVVCFIIFVKIILKISCSDVYLKRLIGYFKISVLMEPPYVSYLPVSKVIFSVSIMFHL